VAATLNQNVGYREVICLHTSSGVKDSRDTIKRDGSLRDWVDWRPTPKGWVGVMGISVEKEVTSGQISGAPNTGAAREKMAACVVELVQLKPTVWVAERVSARDVLKEVRPGGGRRRNRTRTGRRGGC
jgi:hypothetical protein